MTLLSGLAFVKTLQKEPVATPCSSLESTLFRHFNFSSPCWYRQNSLLFSHCNMRRAEDYGSLRAWSIHLTLTSRGHPQTTIIRQLQKVLQPLRP